MKAALVIGVSRLLSRSGYDGTYGGYSILLDTHVVRGRGCLEWLMGGREKRDSLDVISVSDAEIWFSSERGQQLQIGIRRPVW